MLLINDKMIENNDNIVKAVNKNYFVLCQNTPNGKETMKEKEEEKGLVE